MKIGWLLEMAQCPSDARIKCLSTIFLDFSSWSQDSCYSSRYYIQVHRRKKGEMEGKERVKISSSSPLIRKTRVFPNVHPLALLPPYFYLCFIFQNWVTWWSLATRMIEKDEDENRIIEIGVHQLWATIWAWHIAIILSLGRREVDIGFHI